MKKLESVYIQIYNPETDPIHIKIVIEERSAGPEHTHWVLYWNRRADPFDKKICYTAAEALAAVKARGQSYTFTYPKTPTVFTISWITKSKKGNEEVLMLQE